MDSMAIITEPFANIKPDEESHKQFTYWKPFIVSANGDTS